MKLTLNNKKYLEENTLEVLNSYFQTSKNDYGQNYISECYEYTYEYMGIEFTISEANNGTRKYKSIIIYKILNGIIKDLIDVRRRTNLEKLLD